MFVGVRFGQNRWRTACPLLGVIVERPSKTYDNDQDWEEHCEHWYCETFTTIRVENMMRPHRNPVQKKHPKPTSASSPHTYGQRTYRKLGNCWHLSHSFVSQNRIYADNAQRTLSSFQVLCTCRKHTPGTLRKVALYTRHTRKHTHTHKPVSQLPDTLSSRVTSRHDQPHAQLSHSMQRRVVLHI